MDRSTVRKRFMVASYASERLTGNPNELWFSSWDQAEDEVRRRFQVGRWHRDKHESSRQHQSIQRTDDGFEWHSAYSVDFRRVSKSHPDFHRSGGCTIHEMHTVVEDKQFVNPFEKAK